MSVQTNERGVPASSLVTPYDVTAIAGLPVGSTISVPPAHVAVVVYRGHPLDVLQGGTYSATPASLPLLSAKVKMQTDTAHTVDATVYLVRTGRVGGVLWQQDVAVSRSRPHGLAFCMMRGRASLRVVDPAVFIAAMLGWARNAAAQQGSEAQRAFPTLTGDGQRQALFARANLAEMVTALLPANLGAWVGEAVAGLKLSPEQAAMAREQVRAASQAAVTTRLRSLGIECFELTVDAIDAPRRSACAVCGSETAPTAYALLRRNVSLFHVRYETRREGNFCVPCAVKTALAFNATMLVVGYWGYIGMALTPVYSVLNLYHLGGVLFGRKLPVRP